MVSDRCVPIDIGNWDEPSENAYYWGLSLARREHHRILPLTVSRGMSWILTDGRRYMRLIICWGPSAVHGSEGLSPGPGKLSQERYVGCLLYWGCTSLGCRLHKCGAPVGGSGGGLLVEAGETILDGRSLPFT